MSTEIDDLFLILRAQTAPMIDGFIQAGLAGDEMATQVTEASAVITASTERMAAANRMFAGSADEMALQASIDYQKMAAETAALSAKMDAAAVEATAANERLGVAMEATGRKAGPSATALGLVGLAAAAGGYELVKAAANFQSATVRLVTSAGETQQNLDGVRQGILALTGQVGDSADQLAAAMYVIESGGQHGADGLKVLQAAAEGAKAENADLTVVADAVTSVLQDYHLKASDAATVTSKLVAAVGAGKTNFQELAGSLHSVLPLASSLHISLSDVAAALASMTVHGMSADQAAQNLNDTIKHLAAPTGVQIKELGQLGVSVSGLTDMMGQKGITGTLQYLSETILQHMGPSGRVLLDAFNKSKDAANDANIMISKMPVSIQGLARQFQSGSISMGDWHKALKALPTDQATLLSQFAALQSRASGFNDLLKSGAPAAQTYQDALRRATGDATGLSTALMLTGENTDYVNNAVKTVSGATTEAGGHVKGWSEIQTTFNQKMSEAKDSLGALAIEIGQKLLPPVSTFVGWLASGASWLAKHKVAAQVLGVALAALAVSFTVGAAAVWVMNSALLANPITWIVAAFVLAAGIMVATIIWISHHWRQSLEGWKIIGEAIGHWFAHDFAGFFVRLWDHIWGFLRDVGHWFAAKWDEAIGAGKKAIAWLEALPGRVGAALTALPGLLERGAVEGMHRLMYAIGYGLGSIVRAFIDWPPKIWREIVRLWDGAGHLVEAGYHATISWFKRLGADAVHLVEDWWHDTTTTVSAGIDAAVKFVSQLPGKVEHWFVDMYHRAYNFTSDMIRDVVAFIASLPDRAKTAVSTLPGKIMSALSDAGQWLWNTGRNIIQGLLNGASSMIQGAINTVKGWGHDIMSGFNSAMGIHSPSTKFAEAGANLVAGLVKGITDNAHLAHAAIGGLVPSSSGQLGMAGGRYLSPSVGAGMLAGPSGGSGGGSLVIPIHIDGREVFRAVVPYAQQNWLRNGSTFLSRSSS